MLPKPGQPFAGGAVVLFESPEVAMKVILKGAESGGKPLALAWAGGLIPNSEGKEPPTDDLGSRSVMANGWPESPTEPMVRKAFPTATGVIILKKWMPFAGEAYVQFFSAEEARKATERGASVGGKALKLTWLGSRAADSKEAAQGSEDLLSRTLFSSEWPEEPTAAVVQKAFSGVSTAALKRSSGRFTGEVVLRFRSAEAARVALEKGATVDGKALKLTPAANTTYVANLLRWMTSPFRRDGPP
eukprot:TRINITY_DN11607_c0_g1_i1.p1 TRINITY_DN11607_c0_g1~~TRINITY_DN11607_c0_g1_i1.p1  ORF type:complete len:245 (-),score=17.24 TRINITY_DN11607_c0_g1_i1:115-849(-)